MTEQLEAQVAVVGAGPAGIAAAVHAAEAGRRVLLLDPAPRPGGQIWRHWREPPRAALPWLERLVRSGAAVLGEATVVDAPAPGAL
ncbi:MAG: FAD-dependent oxidoreductase, partial [Betaproteobacteria bacterium]